jgi:trehalose 6-phosphate phosphatase
LTIPGALARWQEIERRLAGARPVLFLDYDGTLSPIAPRPELATLPAPTRRVLARLAARLPVAVLSGRGLDDVRGLVGIEGIVYAGSHGFDVAGPGLCLTVGDGIPARIADAAVALRRRLAGIAGILVEDKGFAVAVHFRLVAGEDLPAVEDAVREVAAAYPDLRVSGGKKVFELRPALDWDKGRVLLWLLDRLAPSGQGKEALPLYVGDDVTDEDAFRAIAGRGLGILVAEEPRETAATYCLRDPEEVRQFLEKLAELPAG